MKNINIFTLITIVLLACSKDEPIEIDNNNYFHIDYLDSLQLNKLNSFWENETEFSIKKDMDIPIYNRHISYVGGIQYQQNNKTIVLTVFQNDDMAINAIDLKMESTIPDFYNMENGILKHSNSEGISITKAKYNTLIDVIYSNLQNEENTEVYLMSNALKTAIEIENRIENFGTIKDDF